ncbi:hypothetical protein LCER1_G004091 [Lachnellula cervina]|uniref:RBR-type E3 ubiquitin transferase n=1 Tax=Lachnellula cervina TaxID=1316786 RepID=A0A7D8UTU2_9HELO|nr:hypothetical protein LCER1_G004091 [Lachnellula cervina]
MARINYKEFPSSICGVHPQIYTKGHLCQILTHYRKRHRKSDSKSILLGHLVTLEANIANEEYARIRDWMYQHRTLRLGFSKFVATGKNALDEGSDEEDAPYLKRRNVIGSARSGKEVQGDSEDMAVANPKGIPSPAIPVPQITIECAVCMESLESENLYQQKITPSCDHETRICASCVTQSINFQIQEISWDMINCPLCPELMPFECVKEIASEEAFQRYDRNSVIAAFRHMPNFTYCLNAGCDSGQIHGGGDDQPIMTCTTCQFKTCFTHKTAWHSDLTCTEYDEMLVKDKERTEQEEASQKF